MIWDTHYGLVSCLLILVTFLGCISGGWISFHLFFSVSVRFDVTDSFLAGFCSSLPLIDQLCALMVEPVWISPRCVAFFQAASALLAWWLWTASVWACPAVSLFVCPFSVLQYLYLSVRFLSCNIFIWLSVSDNSFAGDSNFACTFLLSRLVLYSPGFYSCWGEKRKHNVGREGGDTELNGKTPSTLGAASWCPTKLWRVSWICGFFLMVYAGAELVLDKCNTYQNYLLSIFLCIIEAFAGHT